MELSITVAIQVAIMFIIVALGFIMKKVNVITKDGSKQLSDILLVFVTPCVIIKAYQTDLKMDLVTNLLIAFVASIIIHFVAMLVTGLIFGRKKDGKSIINQYSAAYSNCGFMGIPLLEAVLGSQGVFYGAAYLAVFNVINWTHGVYLFTQDKKSFSLKKIILNPGLIGVAAGLSLFFLQIRLPEIVSTAVNYMAGLNTPLAMILIGVFLADVDFKKAIKNVSLYFVSFVRLIVIPLISILLMKTSIIPPEVAVAVIIPAACPSAAAGALFAAKYDLDPGYASEIVSINTIMSIVTIPLIVMANSYIPVFF